MKRHFLLIVLTVCVAISFTACKKSLKEIIAETKQATFTIYTYDEYGSPSGSGSGFFIDKTGTGVTNFHVLDGAVKAFIKTTDSLEYEIDQIIASDQDWDIAKFTTRNEGGIRFPYLTFADKATEQGDKVYNISAPLGLEQTVSEGIVSSLRTDSHGKIVQITAPISPGSSGSAILNEEGKVIAVATFYKQGGQNLNFGVSINQESISALSKNDFLKRYPNFNKKDDFVILNTPAARDGNVTLHALEFKPDATIAYLSYTHLNMAYENMYIWAELDKGDEGFLIWDKDRNEKHYIVSSTLGINKKNGTEIALASNHRFKVYFPAIKDTLHNIDVTYGTTSRGWQFRKINLDYYRSKPSCDAEKYIKEYACSTMQKGDLMEAASIFTTILDENPEDAQALNAMGIISYAIDNNMDAFYYFTKAIDAHPNNTLALYNRSYLYKYQNEYKKALDDISKAIHIDPAQPDNYVLRGMLYMNLENYDEAINDFSRSLSNEDFAQDATLLFYRALCYAQKGNFKQARNDVQSAYNNTSDPELEKALQDLWEHLF